MTQRVLMIEDDKALVEEVDLLALLAEQGTRSGAEISGQPATIQGDPRML